MTKEVSKFAFPKDGKPSKDTILTGFKDIVSDTLFNAVGTVTARKIAEKENFNYKFDPVQKKTSFVYLTKTGIKNYY